MTHVTRLSSLLLGVVLASGVATAQTHPSSAILRPELFMSWRAPWGDPRATQTIVADCADTTGADTLYLTIRSPRNVLPLLAMTGTLLFEPQRGDTLGEFWNLERSGANAGHLAVDFDLLSSDLCSSPWKVLVGGSVGYTRAGGRGRLDMTADVPFAHVYNLHPNECYFFGRVTLHRARGYLAGCGQPMRISWIGGRVRSSRRGSESLAFGIGPNRTVTWNAQRQGLGTRRTRLAMETWVPRHAPPSRGSLPVVVSSPQVPPQAE